AFPRHENGLSSPQPVRRPCHPVRQGAPPGTCEVPRIAENRVYLEHLALSDVRSYAQVNLSLEPGVTVTVGYNGIGKTHHSSTKEPS
ncbi:MAG: hypothetical protein M3021_09865, partial [Actinomycetota bacterium]|nr:hypothetical protein [Actinomycetota bacterium]